MRVPILNLGYAPDVIGWGPRPWCIPSPARSLRAAPPTSLWPPSRAETSIGLTRTQACTAYFLAAHPMGNLLMESHATQPMACSRAGEGLETGQDRPADKRDAPGGDPPILLRAGRKRGPESLCRPGGARRSEDVWNHASDAISDPETKLRSSARPVRILVLHPDVYYFGGAELLCVRVLSVLQQRHAEIVLLHAGGPLDIGRIEAWSGVRLDPERVRFESVVTPGWLSLLKLKPILLRYAIVLRAARRMADDADLVVSTNGECPLSARRLIQFVHFPLFFFDRESLARLGSSDLSLARHLVRAAYVLMSRRIAGWSRAAVTPHLTIANSRWTASEFLRRYDGHDVQFMHFGANVSLHPGAAGWIPFERRADNFVVLGRVVPGKRVEDAVEIVGRLRERGHEVGLRLVGAPWGDYAERVRALLANKPWAYWYEDLGREDLECLVVGQKWGLHCYRFEHYGIASVELQRLGCIVFVHNSGGQREVVTNPAQRYTDLDDAVAKIDAVLREPSMHPVLLASAYKEAAKHTVESFERAVSLVFDEVLAGEGT